MKIKGKKIEGLNIEEIVIPRGEDDAIIFRAQAVAQYDEFDALCPKPRPKLARNRKGELVERTDEASYQEQINLHNRKRIAFMVIKSLSITEGLEWETVNIEDSNTWLNYHTELVASGFTDIEIGRIFAGVMSACGLNEEKVEKARERFLAGNREELEERLSLKDEVSNTLSGEPVIE